MTSLSPDIGTIRAKAPPVVVSMRRYWSEQWQEVPGIECDYFEFGAQPGCPAIDVGENDAQHFKSSTPNDTLGFSRPGVSF